MSPVDKTILKIEGLTKRYAVNVLDDVCFDLRAGEIHGLLGANGAGKSTMCRIIAGLLPLTSGTMELDGNPYGPQHKHAAEDLGVQIVPQELNLIPTLSVAENLLLGRMPSNFGVIRRSELHSRARTALKRFGLDDVDSHMPVSRLGIGYQQMLEIAKALDRPCKILILDEPTACLSPAESARLFEQLDRLRGNGVGIIYISHRLEEVARICQRVSVLRDGVLMSTEPTDSISIDSMIAKMSGTGSGTLGPSVPPRSSVNRVCKSTDKTVLKVENLTRRGAVHQVSLEVKAGERLGIAGLVGSGRTELLRLMFGADKTDSGCLRLAPDFVPQRIGSPSQAVRSGLAMVTEDRKVNGLMLSQSVRVNASLAAMYMRFSKWGWINRRTETDVVQQFCESMDTRCTSIEQVVGSLSGGNQQKVAIAKWLIRDAQVFLFDEPTRGIDITSRRRIYELLDRLADEGKGVVIVSSDLEELLENCDRILVMSSGRLTGEFHGPVWSRDAMMRAAFAGYSEVLPQCN